MDNATIHKTNIFKKYIKDHKLDVIYNIPYNPETNPIENVFGWLKNYVKRNNNSSENEIRTTINEYLKCITYRQLNNTFNKSFNFDKYCDRLNLTID